MHRSTYLDVVTFCCSPWLALLHALALCQKVYSVEDRTDFAAELVNLEHIGRASYSQARPSMCISFYAFQHLNIVLRCSCGISLDSPVRRSAEDALGIISGSVDLKEFSDYRLNFEGVKRALASKIHIGAHVL